MAQEAVIAALEVWERVGRRVAERRMELELNQDQVGASKAVVSALENGRQASFARSTLVKVCRALGWTTDSIDRMIAGGEPVELETAVMETLARAERPWKPDIDRLEERIARLEELVERQPDLELGDGVVVDFEHTTKDTARQAAEQLMVFRRGLEFIAAKGDQSLTDEEIAALEKAIELADAEIHTRPRPDAED